MIRRWPLWVALGLAPSSLVGGCNGTERPRENFVPSSAGARSGLGGRSGSGTAATSGGRSSSGGVASGGVTDSERGGRPDVDPRGGASTGEGGSGVGQGGAGSAEGGDAATAGSGGDGSSSPGFDCGDPPVNVAPFTKEALRGAAADCAAYHYCRFEGAALALSRAVGAHADAPDEVTRAAAERAFRTAMASWSRAELFQFGPLASKSESAGKDSYQGQGLRDLIYSWPATARCRVEEQIASQGYATKGAGSLLISARGLFGIEYSLFYDGTDSACAPASSTGQLWPTLAEAELAQRKRDYARVLADDVLSQAQALNRAWSADGGNFAPLLVSASGYPSDQEAMNVLGFAMIYVEREVKDWKLGVPAGYTLTHPVNGPESPFLGLSTANIRENLRGFRSLFEGCGPDGEGIGFDDWLREVGHGELADDILVAWRNAQASADASPPLDAASAEEIEVLYRAIKALTDLLKTDLFGTGSPLNLKLPAGVEGDTD